MVVRDSAVRRRQKRTTAGAPVSCLNFHKPVPAEGDAFASFAWATPLVRAILLVSNAAKVGPFVTQLAVWRAMDDIDPKIVGIGRRWDSSRQVASTWDARLSEAILDKASQVAQA